MTFAVDFQFFKQPGGDILVKELAIADFEEKYSEPLVRVFQPPFKWCKLSDKYKRENTRLTSKVHGLSWDSGDLEYKEIGPLIRHVLGRKECRVYVIGSTKKNFLQRFGYNPIDVTDLGYLQVDVTKTVHFCHNHDFGGIVNCAGQNVKSMKKFLVAQIEWEDESMEWEYV